jgi:hypothetical protein
MWQVALKAKTDAMIRGNVDAAERSRLDEREADLRERRDALWNSQVIPANEALRLATTAAQQRREEAATA